MIAVLAWWLLLFFLLLPGGVLISNVFKLNNYNLPVTQILGMLAHALAFSAVAFFFPLGGVAFGVCLAANISLGIYYRQHITSLLRAFWTDLVTLPRFYKVIAVALFIAALLKSVQVPSLPDNESYYVQTIKWLNEYGFVTGLGNLHLFLGQTSGWHVLQAGLNLSFASDSINDLNGFLFVICMLYYFTEGSKYRGPHWLSVYPIFSVVFLLFVDSPSPDLPLILILPIVLHLFVRVTADAGLQKTVWLLFIFLAFIKITIAPLGLVFLFTGFRKQAGFYVATGLFVALLWMAKNIILTGYPLYPFTLWQTGVSWQVPEHFVNGLNAGSNTFVYGTKAAGMAEKLLAWIMHDSFAGLFNKGLILLLVVLPLFKKIRTDKKYHIFYFAFAVQSIVLLFTSPQMRFFLPGVLFFTAFILSEVVSYVKHSKQLYYIVLLISILSLLLLFLPVFPFRKSLPQPTLKAAQILLPEGNSRYTSGFVKQQEGNLNYYSPAENFFFYGTGNGPLPTVNSVQIRYFKKKYHVVPQLRGATVEDGFYSAPVSGSE